MYINIFREKKGAREGEGEGEGEGEREGKGVRNELNVLCLKEENPSGVRVRGREEEGAKTMPQVSEGPLIRS